MCFGKVSSTTIKQQNCGDDHENEMIKWNNASHGAFNHKPHLLLEEYCIIYISNYTDICYFMLFYFTFLSHFVGNNRVAPGVCLMLNMTN